MTKSRFPTLSIQPELASALRESGQDMREFTQLLGRDEQLFGFTDFRERGPYSTSTLYVVTQSGWDALVQQLLEVRSVWNVESRTLQYKSRNSWQRLWKEAIDPWLLAIKQTPGIAICVAVSKELISRSDVREFLTEVTKSQREVGSRLTGKSLCTSMMKLTPFLVAAPALPRRGAFAWYSDHDVLTSGAMSDIFMEYAMDLLSLGGSSLNLMFPSYQQHVRLPENVQMALSVPDLVSGVLSDWLADRDIETTAENTALDPAGFQLLAGLAQLSSPTETRGTKGRLHIVTLDSNVTEDGWHFDAIKLNTSARR